MVRGRCFRLHSSTCSADGQFELHINVVQLCQSMYRVLPRLTSYTLAVEAAARQAGEVDVAVQQRPV